MHVVVVDECDAPAVNRIDRVAVDVLQLVLAGIVGRVRLAGEHDLHVAAVPTGSGPGDPDRGR